MTTILVLQIAWFFVIVLRCPYPYKNNDTNFNFGEWLTRLVMEVRLKSVFSFAPKRSLQILERALEQDYFESNQTGNPEVQQKHEEPKWRRPLLTVYGFTFKKLNTDDSKFIYDKQLSDVTSDFTVLFLAILPIVVELV